MLLIADSTEVDELVTLDEAKRHLRIRASSFDDEVRQKLSAAREFVEHWTCRTLTGPRVRTYAVNEWWADTLKLPYPPLFINVDNEIILTYFDDDDDEQTLAASNYQVLQSLDGYSYLRWSGTVTLPSLFTRDDAVRIAIPSGYTELPNKFRIAILMELTRLWGDAKGRDLEYADRAAFNLRSSLDSGNYQ